MQHEKYNEYERRLELERQKGNRVGIRVKVGDDEYINYVYEREFTLQCAIAMFGGKVAKQENEKIGAKVGQFFFHSETTYDQLKYYFGNREIKIEICERPTNKE